MTASATDQPKTVQKPSKRERTGGRPVKITLEIVARVAENLAVGLPLRHALRLAHPDISTVHWARTLERDTRIASAFEAKEGAVVKQLLSEMQERACDPKRGQWTALAWILERRWRDDYGQKPNNGTNVTVQVNTLVGIQEDVLKRAASFVARNNRVLAHDQARPTLDAVTISKEKVISKG